MGFPVGKTRIALCASLLLLPLAAVAVVRWISTPVRSALPSRSQPVLAPRPRPVAPIPRQSSAPGQRDPNLPLFRGDTRRIVARAIDDTAVAPLDHALVALGRRLLGSPYRPASTARRPGETLQLDLTAYDDLRFVEQLLALVNSRQVKTKTEGVDRFSDHVRQLRYVGGRVDSCRRLDHRSLWAAAAARRGYLVDLSRFLPGAQLQPVALAALMDPSPGPAARPVAGAGDRPSPVAGSRSGAGMVQPASPCRLPPGSPTTVNLAYVPLAQLPAALPSLRSGDLFVLVSRQPERDQGRIGLVERNDGGVAGRGATQGLLVGSLMVLPGQGVSRRDNLVQLTRATPGTIGVSFLRAVPNGDGRPDR